MKAIQIVFSPTGGTKKVTDSITKDWSQPITTVDLTDPAADFSGVSIDPDDAVLIAVPSFGGRVPALAAQRISMLRGNGAKCGIVCVYGNRAYEDTLVELQNLAQQSGFRVMAAVSAVAEHSIMHQYATGRPDQSDMAELERFGGEILSKLTGEAGETPAIPGNRPYKKSGGGGMVPKAGKDCVSCGLCAKKCPAQAIDHADPKTVDGKKCISCMRCVSVCPKSARKVNEAMVSAVALAIKKACSVRKDNELFI